MREIKFRAWDKEEKKMTEIFEIGGNNSICYRDIEDVYMCGKDDLGCLEFEIMQYTGLKDKNGKEIYERDIIKNNRYECLSEVIWKQTEACKAGIVKGVFGEDNDLDGFISEIGGFKFSGIGKYKDKTKAHYIGEFEIIGNIYENPELIK